MTTTFTARPVAIDYTKWNDFELAVAAKNANANAWMELWGRYRKPMMGIIARVKGMTQDEICSEAYELFAHKLNLFDATKVKVNPAAFTFSFMVVQGAKNRRTRLINESKRNDYLSDNEYTEAAPTLSDKKLTVTHATRLPEWEATKYSAETLYVRSNEDTETARINRLYKNLSSFQKDALRLRRAGYKLREIAEMLDCSISKVKVNIRDAKLVASEIFEVAYA